MRIIKDSAEPLTFETAKTVMGEAVEIEMDFARGVCDMSIDVLH